MKNKSSSSGILMKNVVENGNLILPKYASSVRSAPGGKLIG
jgi:hypothetical protein